MSKLPLEDHLVKLMSKSNPDLPGPHDYKSIYFNILSVLKVKVYPVIDIGLSQSGGVFTFHNTDHFDLVVRKAGELIGISSNKYKCDLSAYEIFVLLIAIRIHDAGNVFGREEHERRCDHILSLVYGDNFPYKETELHTIAKIAQAHGGKNPDGDKDVIGVLPSHDSVGNTTIRTHRIAAIVRLADELAENNVRIPSLLLSAGKIPKQNEVYHYYGQSLQSNSLVKLEIGNKVNLTYSISVVDAKKKLGKDELEVYLIDEIRNRLVKMNQERVYCNQFLVPEEKLESISAKIIIRDSSNKQVWENTFLIRDDGYPNHLSTPPCLEKLDSNLVLSHLG